VKKTIERRGVALSRRASLMLDAIEMIPRDL